MHVEVRGQLVGALLPLGSPLIVGSKNLTHVVGLAREGAVASCQPHHD